MAYLFPAQFPALISFMSGQFTWLEMQQIDHLNRFSMYLNTNAIQWKMLNIAFQMWYVRRLFRHSFWHWFNFFRSKLQDQKCKKWSFMPIYDVFKYRWHLIEMPDNAYQMRDVRWVSGIFSGIDLIFSGAIYMTRNAKNNHLCQFLTYLRTRITINFIKKESHK